MGSTKLFRAGALALSVSALAFVVWTAAAPGCAPNEVATPDKSPGNDKAAQPPTVTPPAAGTAQAIATATATAAPTENVANGATTDVPRFMGASKAAPVWDEDHMPGKKGAAQPAQQEAPKKNASPGGSK